MSRRKWALREISKNKENVYEEWKKVWNLRAAGHSALG